MTSTERGIDKQTEPDITPRQIPSTGIPAALKRTRTYDTACGPVRVGFLDQVADWELLEPCWDVLLARTPGATIFARYAFLRIWWDRFALHGHPFLVVVLADDAVQAIAPLQISPYAWLKRNYRCLRFLGAAPEIDRPVALIPKGREELAESIADYVMDHRDMWDSVFLAEQQPNSPFLTAVATRLRTAGMVVSVRDLDGSPCVDVDRDWQSYLANRSRAQRKSIKRKNNQLRRAGEVAIDVVDSAGGLDAALDRFIRVEDQSWKRPAGIGIAASDASLKFNQALIRRYSGDDDVQLRFLCVDGMDIAATIGILWRGVFYSLQVTYHPAWHDYSPGYLLTALELKEACDRNDIEWVNYLGGEAKNNKIGWTTLVVPTQSLYAHPHSLLGQSFHAYHFHIHPWLKPRLDRLGVLPFLRRLKDRIGRLRRDPTRA